MYHKDSKLVICNSKSVASIQRHVKLLTLLLKETSKLTESYILDYFVDELWTVLPKCWLDTTKSFEPCDLECLLNFDKEIRYKHPWPLSLLAFRESIKCIILPRKPVTSLKCVENFIRENIQVHSTVINQSHWENLEASPNENSCQNKNIPEFCRRHVKPKKQHEIFRIGQLTSAVANAFDVKHIIDIGSGQGHLSRFLALYHNLSVVTVEADKSYVTSAENFDKQAVSSMKRQKKTGNFHNSNILNDDSLKTPHHLEGWMTAESSKDFLTKVLQKLNLEENSNRKHEESFTLLGLHTCGDLATTILNMFVESRQSKAVLSAGCCYMKLSTDIRNRGYPLSSYVKSLPHHQLSYEAREMACHAIEMYCQRLRGMLKKLYRKFHLKYLKNFTPYLMYNLVCKNGKKF